MMLSRCSRTSRSKGENTRRPKSGMLSLWMGVLCLLFSGGCALKSKTPDHPGALVDEKYSLKEDREAFANLRKDIPEEVRRDNDEKAFMAEMMADFSRTPAEVRNQFSRILNKKRELFSKDMSKAREKFNQEQKSKREEFSKNQSNARSRFAGQKKTSAERTDFYSRLDGDRREFNSEQQSLRDEFEADMREKRKNFDDYIRAKTDEFNQLHRDYAKRYDEDKKARGDLKKQAEEQRRQKQKSVDAEYDTIRKQTPTYLETNEGQ